MGEQTPLRFPPRGATPGSVPAPPRRPEPLPAPTGQPPYRLTLASLLPDEGYEQVRSAGQLTFHLVGDVGGVQRPEIQLAVAEAMARDAHDRQDPARFLTWTPAAEVWPPA